MKRRRFLKQVSLGAGILFTPKPFTPKFHKESTTGKIISVNGMLDPAKAGIFLPHEHILVDFTGADRYDPGRWDRQEVIRVMEPYLLEIIKYGGSTFVDCTPEYLGRDPNLLKELSELTGLHILTNTGYYGAGNNKYLPSFVYAEKAEELAGRWIREFKNGIGDTRIRPGFIKVGVNDQPLSPLHRKLLEAAALTHLETGMTIASHSGSSIPAFEELQVLSEFRISPSAFIWVHAQNEPDLEKRREAARQGAWVSLDGLNETNVTQYVDWIKDFKENHCLEHVLVSHDSGWYTPGPPYGGKINGYTVLFRKLLPSLRENSFKEQEINQIIKKNPSEAFRIRVRKY